jgi:hypothetical protein
MVFLDFILLILSLLFLKEGLESLPLLSFVAELVDDRIESFL